MKHAQGTSLLDVLITLSVAVLLVGVALPNFRATLAAGERTAAINGLLSALHLARRVALTRAEVVVLCKSPDTEQCSRGQDLGWAPGILAFVNLDGDDPPQVDDDEPILYRDTLPRGVDVSANREAFFMRPYGRRSTNGTFTVCDRRGASHARAVIVSWTGRPRIAPTTPSGEALQCPST
ncbi:MAG: GspH/FimT family pseudopilin [Pseudomonadota bacterium]